MEYAHTQYSIGSTIIKSTFIMHMRMHTHHDKAVQHKRVRLLLTKFSFHHHTCAHTTCARTHTPHPHYSTCTI